MLPALAYTLLWIPAVLGWGSTVDPRPARYPDGITLLLGAGVLSLVSMAWTLMLPASPWLAAGCSVAGWALFLLRVRPRSSFDGRAASVVTAAAAVNAVMSALAARYTDMGLYYLQATEWLVQMGAVRGLSHLQPQLAFSRPVFALAAALEFPWTPHSGGFVLSGVAFVGACLLPVRGWRALGRRPTIGGAFLLSSAVACGLFVESLGTHSPDLLVAVLAFGTFSAFFMAMDGQDRDQDWAGVATLLGSLAVAVKINAALLLLPAMWLQVRRLGKRDVATPAVGAAAAGVLLVGLSGIHQWLASGCFEYPVAWTCTDVAWGSRSSALALQRLIMAWNRHSALPTDEVLAMGWGWVWRWFVSWHVLPFVVVCAGFLLGSTVLAWRLRERPGVSVEGLVFVATICLGGMAAWFATAPAIRFSYGYSIPLTVLPMALVIAVSVHRRDERLRRLALVALGGLSVAMAGWGLRTTLGLHRRPIPINVVGWPALPRSEVEWKWTAGGAAANVPAPGQLCWDAPIPCVPGQLDPRLKWGGGQYVLVPEGD